MFDSIRQWFFVRLSEPLLRLIQSRRKVGPLKAAAFADFGIGFLHASFLPAMFFVLVSMGVTDLFGSTNMTRGLTISCALGVLVLLPSAFRAYDLICVADGQKSVLSGWTVGIVSTLTDTWKFIPGLVFVSTFVSGLMFFLSTLAGVWQGFAMGLLVGGLLLLECVSSAIWQNTRVRNLVTASTPARY
ncbi:hypothetical protein HZA87_04125 [Candidatus Uhrbacteria bacterium]|nr:hypothetical protein [Candidatus Uhrbacteria bacterium]